MQRAVRTATPALALLLALAANAQPGAPPDASTLRGESLQTRKRLAEAEQKLISGKPAEAADDLQRIMDEVGDDLVTLDARQHQTARRVIHALLAKLPADALKAYRDRVDQPAKKLLDQAKRERDPRPLWQLLDRYFVSHSGDEALLLLGDLLFERGEFRAAEDAWRRLLPNSGADITYPNSKADPALVRARIVLAVIFQNDSARAKKEYAAFQSKHPGAAGALAGKTGPLAPTLKAYLDAQPKLAPPAGAASAWPTFGGAPDRAGRVPGGMPNAWPSRPSWKSDILEDDFGRGAAGQPLPQPFGHPVVAGSEVFVASGSSVLRFDLQTGKKSRDEYSPALFNPGNRPAPPAHCTLTATGKLLYARLGPSAVRAPEPTTTGRYIPETAIACVSVKEGKFTELWKLLPPEDEKVATAWEGAPLVGDRKMWAVYAKFDGGRVTHVLACYDPADAGKPPARPAWTTELCENAPGAGDRVRQELLTLAGRNVVFCSNNGAVVAVDTATGRRAWAFRYPRSRRAVIGETGEPAPAVAFGGRVFVAPADGERVYAFDAETGRLLWESGPVDDARIVGVARNRLVVAVAGPLRGVRGLNLDTGSHRESDGGWVQSADVLTHGQGLVADNVIVWPTRDGLFFLSPEDGRPDGGPPNPFRGPNGEKFFGNVAYADGVMVVVTAKQVWGYRAQSRKIEVKPDAPPRERFDIMVDRAERELADGDAPRARAILAEVAAGDMPAPFRAWAAARMLQLAPPAADLQQHPREVREALRPAILSEWILAPEGVPVTLDAFLRRKLGREPAAGSVPTPAAESKPCAPALADESVIIRTHKLPPAVAPLRLIAGGQCPRKHLFAAGPKVLVAVPLDQSKTSEYSPADVFTHAADVRTGFVAAGPFAVALYGAAREPLWVFRVPVTNRLPGDSGSFRLRCDCEPDCPHLSSFTLAGSWLVACLGEHHLIALDLEARRVAWVLNSTGRAGYEASHFPRAVRFGPHFAISGALVVVQLSDGKRWFVELLTGRPVARPALGEHTAKAFWQQPPACAGGNQLLLSDGPGLVRLVQLGGRVKWAFESEYTEGFAGDPAQVRVWNNVPTGGWNPLRVPPWSPLLLVAIRRNHGVEIERVSTNDGKAVWSDPAFADAGRIDLLAADADADHAYIPTADKLLAVSLRTGKTVWEEVLPKCERGWVVRTGKDCVIAYPAEAIPAEPTEDVWHRLVKSFRREPFPWRLPGLAGTLYDAWVSREVPVLLLDAETGKRLARFDVKANGPAVAAAFDKDNAVIATGDRVVWIK